MRFAEATRSELANSALRFVQEHHLDLNDRNEATFKLTQYRLEKGCR